MGDEGEKKEGTNVLPDSTSMTVTVPCKAFNIQTGDPCRRTTSDESGFCGQHLTSFRKVNEQKVTRCSDCWIIKEFKDQEGHWEDLTVIRERGCSKAFWVSDKRPELMLRDLCFWSTEAVSSKMESPTEVLEEMKKLFKDLLLQVQQGQRIIAKRGGGTTPDFLQLVDRFTELGKDIIEIQQGKQQFGKPGSVTPGVGGAKGRLMDAILNGKDAFEDGIEVTRKETAKKGGKTVTSEEKVTVEDRTNWKGEPWRPEWKRKKERIDEEATGTLRP